MCGRYSLDATPEELAQVFNLSLEDVERLFEPRYNIAPTDKVLAVRQQRAGRQREPVLLRWGLIPHWARDRDWGGRTINARAETVETKPAFRDPFRERRCLVVATGFYEWQKSAGRKQPYLIRRHDRKPLAFAGLWDRWQGPTDEVVESCTIVTTDANGIVRPIHDRMPVILQPADYDRWLDSATRDTQQLRHLLEPVPDEVLTAHPVSSLVNKPANDVPECVVPIQLSLLEPPGDR
jgi:putative SOS response-associated peptidase YedK